MRRLHKRGINWNFSHSGLRVSRFTLPGTLWRVDTVIRNILTEREREREREPDT